MFSPKQLSKITNDALIRIESERILEVERQMKLAAEIRKVEEEKKVRIQEEIEFNKEVEKYINKLLKLAIEVALLGEKQISILVQSFVSIELNNHFSKYKYEVQIGEVNHQRSKLKLRIQTLIDKLSQSISPQAEYFKKTLIDILDNDEIDIFILEKTVNEMGDDNGGFYEDAILYFRLQIKPLFETLDIVDLTEPSKDSVTIKWKSLDTIDYKFNHIEEAPSWLVSTSGAGLLQNISLCLSDCAKSGSNEAVFSIEKLNIQTERWGDNQMMKVIFKSTPIGVFPFESNVFSDILNYLGFVSKLKSSTTNVQQLSISW